MQWILGLLGKVPVVGPIAVAVINVPLGWLGHGACWLLSQPPEAARKTVEAVLGVGCGQPPTPTP